jgi:hypothetical protein
LDYLVANEKEYTVYDSSFCPNLELRPIPEDRWCEILARFQSTPSLPAMSIVFFAFNEPALKGEGMGHTPIIEKDVTRGVSPDSSMEV